MKIETGKQIKDTLGITPLFPRAISNCEKNSSLRERLRFQLWWRQVTAVEKESRGRLKGKGGMF